MINITFISVHIKKSPLSFPLSSALLASAVDSDTSLKNIFKSNILDLFLDNGIRDSASKIVEIGTNIADFSIYIWKCRSERH